MKILIIEDDPGIASMLQRGLEDEGHQVHLCDDGEEGAYQAAVNRHDVIVLDWMLPVQSGIEVLRELRREEVETPVLMLTARGEIDDKVTGFRSGADDYLPKPFRFEELLVRLESLYRRCLGGASSLLHEGDLTIDLDRKTVKRGEQTLSLTQKEYELLLFLIRHKNQTLSPEMIREQLWGESDYVESNVIQVTIYHLRRKIGKEKIQTRRGMGYRFESA
jgi:DNA-binding response OmpR family regulator